MFHSFSNTSSNLRRHIPKHSQSNPNLHQPEDLWITNICPPGDPSSSARFSCLPTGWCFFFKHDLQTGSCSTIEFLNPDTFRFVKISQECLPRHHQNNSLMPSVLRVSFLWQMARFTFHRPWRMWTLCMAVPGFVVKPFPILPCPHSFWELKAWVSYVSNIQ